MTYRYEGHGVSDKIAKERKDEMAKFQDRDPIKLLAQQMHDSFGAGIDDELKAIAERVEREVEDSVQFALESPKPTYADLFNNIYA
jgi:pyruvate dehydrogenase E1 component alpha subunit